ARGNQQDRERDVDDRFAPRERAAEREACGVAGCGFFGVRHQGILACAEAALRLQLPGGAAVEPRLFRAPRRRVATFQPLLPGGALGREAALRLRGRLDTPFAVPLGELVAGRDRESRRTR